MILFPQSDNRGVTLLEAMVAMAIFLMILGGVVALMQFGFFSRDVIWEQLKTQSEGRRVVQSFIDELRSANYSSLGAYPVEKASSAEFIFFTNLDDDAQTERTRYYLSNGDFIKGVVNLNGAPLGYITSTEVTTTIAHDVANGTSTPVFQYYGENYDGSVTTTPLASPVDVTKIRMVRIMLYLEEEPDISPAPFLIEAKAHLRNLKNN